MPISTTNLVPTAGTTTARAAGPGVAVAAPDYGAIKTRQQATWSSVDFGRIGVRLQIVGESLCEAVDLRAGEKVIDVAAGNGNASLAAARRFADVTSTDYVAALLDQGLRRADADGLSITARLADAEDLPFEDGTFDVALSTFGVMFAPNPPRAADEMLRVVRPGGRIGLASWTPDGFVGQLLRVVGRFVPPPAGVAPPTAWGTETRIVELFGPYARDIHTQRKPYVFRFLSAAHWIQIFRAFYGPVNRAFAALDGSGQTALHQALLELLDAYDVGGGRGLVVPGDYLEVVVTK